MNAQRRFWQDFSDLKRDSIYINRYHAAVEALDRWINVFSAVTSSSAIAGWALWQQIAPVWGTVIAVSQVVTAIRPFLPYRARLKALGGLGVDLDGLAISAENDWFKVSEGLLTDAEIHQLTMTLKRKIHVATSKHFRDMSLPEKRSLLERAESEASTYMARFAEGEGDE